MDFRPLLRAHMIKPSPRLDHYVCVVWLKKLSDSGWSLGVQLLPPPLPIEHPDGVECLELLAELHRPREIPAVLFSRAHIDEQCECLHHRRLRGSAPERFTKVPHLVGRGVGGGVRERWVEGWEGYEGRAVGCGWG